MISSSSQNRIVKLAKKLIITKSGNYERRGICCRWLKVAESWGVKFSDDGYEYMRKVYTRQKRGFRLGLGPYCFGFLKVEVDGCTLYGYITQIAELAWNYFHDTKDFSFEKIEKITKPIVKHLKRLVSDKLYVRANDLHTDNFGYINKRAVITDWGFDGGQ